MLKGGHFLGHVEIQRAFKKKPQKIYYHLEKENVLWLLRNLNKDRRRDDDD